jgi:hypothetical protein
MKDGKLYRHLNYKNLEFFKNIEDRRYTLNSYILANDTLSSYIPIFKDNYLIAYNSNIDLIDN